MAKILTDKEMKDIIIRAIDGDEIGDSDSYKHFLEDLGSLIANHFGGERGTVEYNEEAQDYHIAFNVNECVPPDGGVYAKYDTDVSWEDGEENDVETCECGEKKRTFMHNCSGSSDMPEIHGCPECDDV